MLRKEREMPLMDSKEFAKTGLVTVDFAADLVCQALERVLNEARRDVRDEEKIRKHEIKGLPQELCEGQAIEIVYECGGFSFSKLLPHEDDEDDLDSVGIIMGPCKGADNV